MMVISQVMNDGWPITIITIKQPTLATVAGCPPLKPSYQHLRNPPPRMCHHSLGPVGHARISIAYVAVCCTTVPPSYASCALLSNKISSSRIVIHTPELRCPSGQRPLQLTWMVFYAMSPEEMGRVPCLLCFMHRCFCKHPVCICINNKYVRRCIQICAYYINKWINI